MALLQKTTGSTNDFEALVDQLFNRFPFYTEFRAPGFSESAGPAMDLYEKDGKYVLELSVPGYDPKEINAEINNNVVTISGLHEESSEKKEAKYYRKEMRKGGFTRTITLPQDVDSSTAEAKVTNGVLTLTLSPVKPMAAKKIAIKGSA